jgi:hypothetical protein
MPYSAPTGRRFLYALQEQNDSTIAAMSAVSAVLLSAVTATALAALSVHLNFITDEFSALSLVKVGGIALISVGVQYASRDCFYNVFKRMSPTQQRQAVIVINVQPRALTMP